MKTTIKVLLAIVVLTTVGSTAANADYYRNPNYRYGHNGYWDRGNRYHHWNRYHGRDGYWDTRGGTRIFIDI